MILYYPSENFDDVAFYRKEQSISHDLFFIFPHTKKNVPSSASVAASSLLLNSISSMILITRGLSVPNNFYKRPTYSHLYRKRAELWRKENVLNIEPFALSFSCQLCSFHFLSPIPFHSLLPITLVSAHCFDVLYSESDYIFLGEFGQTCRFSK